jgi:hypothetical protein
MLQAKAKQLRSLVDKIDCDGAIDETDGGFDILLLSRYNRLSYLTKVITQCTS